MGLNRLWENPEGEAYVTGIKSPLHQPSEPSFSHSSDFSLRMKNKQSINQIIPHAINFVSRSSISNIHTFYCVLTIPRGPFLFPAYTHTTPGKKNGVEKQGKKESRTRHRRLLRPLSRVPCSPTRSLSSSLIYPLFSEKENWLNIGRKIVEENNKKRHTDSGGETKPTDLTGFFFFYCFLPNFK